MNGSILLVFAHPDDESFGIIDISDYLDSKIKAIAAHASQQDAREFNKMLEDSRESGFAEKEYLYLAVPESGEKETDLFQ